MGRRLLALNLTASFVYGLLVYDITRVVAAPPDALCRFFLRGAVRIIG